jgi:hypothetical protein
MRIAGLRTIGAVAGIVAFAAVLAEVWPHARGAAEILWAQNDPAALSDARLKNERPTSDLIVRQIDDALVANDAGLAQSFVDLARANDIFVPESVVARVSHAVSEEDSASHLTGRFASGLFYGEANDLASLGGTVAGDLFVFGDVRDVVREGKRAAMGEEPDRLVLGLAAAGIAVTAATYVSVGGVAPLRAGLTLVKDARKAGRLSAGLSGWAGRSAREMVDAPMLQQAIEKASEMASITHPGATLDAMRAVFRAEKAGEIVRVAKDVGRIGEKAGARGALEILRTAEGPKDIERAARLAESKGSQTRALLKIFGRGALLLAAGAFNLSLWVLSALLTLLELLSSIKAATERATLAWLRRSKARHAPRQQPMTAHDQGLAATA